MVTLHNYLDMETPAAQIMHVPGNESEALLGLCMPPPDEGRFRLKHPGSYATAEVQLEPGEVIARSGAMQSMDKGVQLSVACDGGCPQSFCRGCCGGIGCFFTHFKTPKGDPLTVTLSPMVPGEIAFLPVNERNRYIMKHGSFLASDAAVDVTVETQRFALCCCSGMGCCVLKTSGLGTVLATAFGAIEKHELGEGESLIVDNNAVVAWTEGMGVELTLPAGCCASCLSGEGIVLRFTGPGTIFVQTRSLAAFARALAPYLPRQPVSTYENNNNDGGGSSNN